MEDEEIIPFTSKPAPPVKVLTFKEKLKQAIENGAGEDWVWNAEDGDEERVDTFNVDTACKAVIKLLKEEGCLPPSLVE